MSKRLLLLPLLLIVACEHENVRTESAIPVRTEVVKRADFTPSLTLLGVVRAGDAVPIVALTSGTIRYPSRFASGLRTGAEVRAGEQLATIANEKLASAEVQERLRMEAADADLARAQRSFDQGVLSIADYSSYRLRAQLEHEAHDAAKREAKRSSLVAPRAGTLVVSKTIAPGSNVDANTTLGELAGNGAPVIEASVAASERELLRVGQAVTFGEGAHSGSGRIREVANAIDPSGTARVVIAIDNGVVMTPGTGVSATVALDQRRDAMTVPEEAVVATADGAGVFVVGAGEGMFRRYRAKAVHVETGRRAGGRIEILSGLRDGDRVVIAGADTLTDGVAIAEEGSQP